MMLEVADGSLRCMAVGVDLSWSSAGAVDQDTLVLLISVFPYGLGFTVLTAGF